MLCLIPARSGSSLKHKNIRPLRGKPLIAYSIEQGLRSRCDRVIVSTDSKLYAKIAREHGAEVILRPKKYATDKATDLVVFLHALEVLRKEFYYPEICLHLRPTSPIRNNSDIDRALEILEETDVDSVRSIQIVKQTPYKMWHEKLGMLQPVIPSNELWNEPRQVLPKIYAQNGCIDAVRTEVILGGSMTGESIYGLTCEGFDIDTEEDFQRAEKHMEGIECSTSLNSRTTTKETSPTV